MFRMYKVLQYPSLLLDLYFVNVYTILPVFPGATYNENTNTVIKSTQSAVFDFEKSIVTSSHGEMQRV